MPEIVIGTVLIDELGVKWTTYAIDNGVPAFIGRVAQFSTKLNGFPPGAGDFHSDRETAPRQLAEAIKAYTSYDSLFEVLTTAIVDLDTCGYEIRALGGPVERVTPERYAVPASSRAVERFVAASRRAIKSR
jgi:hypothetical protein